MSSDSRRAELQSMSKDELIEQLVVLESRFDSFTSSFNSLEEAILGDASPSELRDDEPLLARLQDVEANVANGGVGDAGPEDLTKVELAAKISREEGIRRSTKGLSGGALDYPTVRDIADREFETELNSGTVYTAWDRLEKKWACFSVKAGGDGPNTKNKQLRCTKDTIPAALRHLVRTEGN